MIMEEIWKDIKDFEGSYQCSNFGRIRSLDRYIPHNYGSVELKKGQIIIPRLNKNGYLQLGLYKNSKRKQRYVHRIIAESFIDNPYSYPTINHKDGNKLNNNVENLEWVTYSENNKHAYTRLGRTVCKNYNGSIAVIVIDILQNITYRYNSIAQASQSIGLSCTQINRYIHSDKKWKGRYIFQTDDNKCVEDIEKVL